MTLMKITTLTNIRSTLSELLPLLNDYTGLIVAPENSLLEARIEHILWNDGSEGFTIETERHWLTAEDLDDVLYNLRYIFHDVWPSR